MGPASRYLKERLGVDAPGLFCYAGTMKKNEELIERRAAKVRKVLMKTKDWGMNAMALLLVTMMVLAVMLFCVGFWNMGLGYVVIGAAVVLTVVIGWNVLDNWSYNELEKARHRRYMEEIKEGK